MVEESCVIPYSAPSAPGVVTLNGTYSGDTNHPQSTYIARLTVEPAPVGDFSVSCSPNSLTANPGGTSPSSTCTVTSINSFNSPVSLTCSGLPPDDSCSFNPATVIPPADGSITSDLTVKADQTAQAGTFPFNVAGTSGSLSHNFEMALNVSFNVVPESAVGTIAIMLASIGGLVGYISFRNLKRI